MLSALSWIPKGSAKQIPERLEPTEEELAILKASVQIEEPEKEVESDSEPSTSDEDDNPIEIEDDLEVALAAAKAVKGRTSNVSVKPVNDSSLAAAMAELEMDKYDDSDDERAGAIDRILGSGNPGMAFYKDPRSDPYLHGEEYEADESIVGSEDEELHLKDTDLLLLAARNEDDVSHLEVWVYEQDDADGPGNLFVHHAIMLPAFPLSVAWLNCHPLSDGGGANLAAVGSFEPGIEIWDLDVIDSVEPMVTLGGADYNAARAQLEKTKSEKKKKTGKKKLKLPEIPVKPGSHSDAVLGLAWNRQHTNILASASADKTIKVWDVKKQSSTLTLTHHTDKAQAVAWCPADASLLLTGGFDGSTCLVDIRAPDFKPSNWKLASDVESLAWDPHNPTRFAVSTEDGEVLYFDSKGGSTSKPIFRLKAHDKATTALGFCPGMSNLFFTASTDKLIKLWSVEGGLMPKQLVAQDLKVGAIFSAAFCADAPFTLAAGGAKGEVAVWNLMGHEDVSKWISSHDS